MPNKVRWGVLSTAQFALKKSIPGMQKGELCEIRAIASRDLRKAEEAARALGIPKAYGSYEELLRDPEIEAIYNPLPNHMHVPWSIKAAEAGKHVLCEKPLSMNVAEAKELLRTRNGCGRVSWFNPTASARCDRSQVSLATSIATPKTSATFLRLAAARLWTLVAIPLPLRASCLEKNPRASLGWLSATRK